MTSFAKALPVFFSLVLFSSLLHVEARKRVFFSKVTHSNGNEPEIPVTEDPATPTYSPLYAPTYAPAPELTLADAPEGALLVPAPAPFDAESEFGYELYGSADQETPITIDVQNEAATQENGHYENTNLYNDNSRYATNGNSEEGYSNNYVNGREGYTNSYYSNNGNGNRVDGFEQQGLSNTRSLENGSYYPEDDMKNENNDMLNGYQSLNEGNFEKRNEFNTMGEYEKYAENKGYMP